MKLTPEEDKLIRLIVKGRGEAVWAEIHPYWYKMVKRFYHENLCVLEDADGGWGRAKLTDEGEEVYNAMRVIN
jgi:hypothetical protein